MGHRFAAPDVRVSAKPGIRIDPAGGLRFSWRRGFRQYADLFEVEKEWRWSGTHYQRTALDWLANFDSRRDEIEGVLGPVYGSDTALWMRRWRWFFLATAGLFGYADGIEWGVSHFRMKVAA
jgi:cyclopropane-fatty-acyl-phospholipid synthase